MKTVTLKAEPRNEVGTKSAKELRSAGLVPCVIYGGEDNVLFAVASQDLAPLIYTADFFNVDVDVDGKTYKTIIKDLQFHPVTDEVLHIDFQELIQGRKVKTSLPVHLEGNAPGVREGGILQHKLLRLNVRVKPENMVEYLALDITSMKLGESLKVKDIDSGAIEVLDSPSIPVASVISPRALRSAKSKETATEVADAEEGTEEGGEAAAAEETAEA